jgi:raffinose/stachyose/melibiose transport system substrate-binding protein
MDTDEQFKRACFDLNREKGDEKMKKLLQTMLILVIVALVAGACTPVAPPVEPTVAPVIAPTIAPTSEPTAAPVEKKAITLWHVQTGAGAEVIQKEVDRYMAAHPEVTVEVVPMQSDGYSMKLTVAMGGGTPPCVFSTWGGGPLYEYVKAGQILDLTEWMNKDNYKDRFLDAGVASITFDGKIWAVPVEHSALAVVFYNKVIFAENGLTPPTTYTELLEVIDKLKSVGIAPFALGGKSQWPELFFNTLLVDRIGGPDVFRKAATRTGGSFEDPAFIKAGQIIQELVNAGAFAEGFNGLDYGTGQSRMLMYSGDAAMEVMGSWNISTIKSENPDFYANNLAFFPFPAVTDGIGDPKDVAGSVGQDLYSVATACKYPQEAFELIQYMIDDEAIAERSAIGRIVPVKSFTTDDPMLKEVLRLLQEAPNVQLWWDQYLPPELGQASLDTTQGLFGLTMTPEEAAKTMEQTAIKVFGK